MGKYRKKPVVVEAFQWTEHVADVFKARVPHWILADAMWGDFTKRWFRRGWWIRTLEGWMRIRLGDWIIQGIKGELYPCKPDIFEETYEAVEEPDRDQG